MIRPLSQPCTVLSRAASAALMFALLALAGPSGAAESKIYRTVDENGNVVFTDVPPRPRQPGEAVELEKSNSFTSPPTPASGATESRLSMEEWLGNSEPGAGDGTGANAVSYRLLQVASPADDEVLRDNAGSVTVSARLEPALATGHVMQLLLDGQLLQSGQTSSFQLVNVDRGTHTVQVRVVGASGETLIASAPNEFHLQRRSVILQPNNNRAR